MVSGRFAQSLISEMHYVWLPSFFSKCLKFDVDSGYGTKSAEKLFRFWDNSIWIGICKFSESWTGYLPSAVNVLTNTPKFSTETREDTFGINFPQNDEKHEKSALMEIWQVFGTLSHVDCQRVFWNGAFSRVVSPGFSQSLISEIH